MNGTYRTKKYSYELEKVQYTSGRKKGVEHNPSIFCSPKSSRSRCAEKLAISDNFDIPYFSGRDRSEPRTRLRPDPVRPAGLLLFGRRNANPREHRAVSGAADDHDHVQRRRQHRQHRSLRGDLQRSAREPERLPDSRNVLRLAQVHELLGRSGSSPKGPRDIGILADAQGRPAVLDAGIVRRLAGRDGRSEIDYRTVRQHHRRIDNRYASALPPGRR